MIITTEEQKALQNSKGTIICALNDLAIECIKKDYIYENDITEDEAWEIYNDCDKAIDTINKICNAYSENDPDEYQII